MADLSVLIKVHKHELDEKRLALAKLYEAVAKLDAARAAVEKEFADEKASVAKSGDIHFTFEKYTQEVKSKLANIAKKKAQLEKEIEKAKDAMMETFSELKKYEMTQQARDNLEAAERKLKEGKIMDEIGLDGFRRKDEEK